MQKIRKFLQIDDGLKRTRMEWLLGVPQLKSKKNIRTNEYSFGAEAIDNVTDDIYEYKSAIMRGYNDGVLAQITKARKTRTDENCLIGLRELILMCLDDDEIMSYVFNAPAPTAQNVRYTDWIYKYV